MDKAPSTLLSAALTSTPRRDPFAFAHPRIRLEKGCQVEGYVRAALPRGHGVQRALSCRLAASAPVSTSPTAPTPMLAVPSQTELPVF